MPSDTMPREDRERTAAVLQALAEPRARYDAALAGAEERMREYLAAHRSQSGDATSIATTELGRFAGGRIDASRFAALFEERALAPDVANVIERAADIIAELRAEGDALFVVHVPTGADLRRVVAGALAEIGRAFGAALAFQAARAGVRRTEWHERLLGGTPFGSWNRTERLLAAPLVVDVDGSDLHADSLAEFLDGSQKIVLVVRGDATPAPLARLVTPGTFVVQAADASELARFAASGAPGIAALLPASCVRFAHDPDGGPTLGERLTIAHIPVAAPRTSVGGRSAQQQREELAQLALLAEVSDLARLHATPRTARGSVANAEAAAPASDAPARGGTVPAAASSGATVPVGGGLPAAAAGARANGNAAGDAGAVDALATWLLAQAGLAPDGRGAGAGT